MSNCKDLKRLQRMGTQVLSTLLIGKNKDMQERGMEHGGFLMNTSQSI